MLARHVQQMDPWASPYHGMDERGRVLAALFDGRTGVMERLEAAHVLQAVMAVPRWATDPGMLEQIRGERADRISELARQSSHFGEAIRAAAISDRYGVPEGLSAFRLGHEEMAERLVLASPAVSGLQHQWATPEFGGAFVGVSAFSEMLLQGSMVGREAIGIASQLSAAGLPDILDAKTTRTFLDAAGLVPPLSRAGVAETFLRTPRVRSISQAERRRRIGMMKGKEAAPRHVVKAYRLIHATERVLRRVIDDLMTLTYGDDWPEQRLPICGCKLLLKRWEKEGGDVLDHADWAHYSLIMSHPQHHGDVFGAGFENAEDLVVLIDKARTLRAAVGHVRSFTPQNLFDLRLVFTTLEEGLIDALPDFELTVPY
ncbi:hypothetical protein [Roseomonas sp. 18066]|uniref:hypothetical protein n=1 Tax=Roseomonas sp. 18066 TaxID=2681412 RepID=UPI001357F7F9|nr:hypothetical protein [Roseomonas sp. 18066]